MSADDDAGIFSDAEKTDLAGNAFNGAVLIPLLTALFGSAPLVAAVQLMGRTAADSEIAEVRVDAEAVPATISESSVDSECFEEDGESEAPVASSPLDDLAEGSDLDDLMN